MTESPGFAKFNLAKLLKQILKSSH